MTGAKTEREENSGKDRVRVKDRPNETIRKVKSTWNENKRAFCFINFSNVFFFLLLLYIFIRLSVFLILINNNIIIVFFLLLPLLLLLFTSVSVTILGENFNFQLFYWMCRRLVTTLLQCATAAPRCGGKHFTRNVKLWNISNSPQRGSHAFCVGCWFIKILFCFCSSSLYALFFFLGF